MPRESVFIGIPCYGEVAPEVLEDFMRFAYHCGRRMPELDFYLGIKTKSEQFRARNAIVEGAIQVGADWLLMLDDDMIVDPFKSNIPTPDHDFLRRLISHGKDIVGALYYQRTGNCSPVAMMKLENSDGYRFLRDDELVGGLQRVDVVGGGCLLIKTRVFDRLAPPYFEPEFQYGTDIQLCRKAADKGFEVWLDSGIELGHLRSERVVVTSRNRTQLQLCAPGESVRTFVSEDVFGRLIEDAVEWTGYRDITEMAAHAQSFLGELKAWKQSGRSNLEWYRQFPRERVARQVVFNTGNLDKRRMTEFILSSVDHRKPLEVLDFGCGIGIPAFTLAEKGHAVTALDVEGTGTLEFLKWRAKKHRVPITFHESRSSVPHLGSSRYDVIIAMDTLEHIPEWRTALRELASRLRPNGVLFSNNAILNDNLHPEHYSLDNRDFVSECMSNGLMPFNQITYVKRVPSEESIHAEATYQLS